MKLTNPHRTIAAGILATGAIAVALPWYVSGRDSLAAQQTTLSSTPTAASPAPTPAAPAPIGLAQAAAIAARVAGGRVIAAELDEDAPTTYDVKVLRQDGQEVKITVDLPTGHVLQQQLDGDPTAGPSEQDTPTQD